MKLNAYPLHSDAVTIQPAASGATETHPEGRNGSISSVEQGAVAESEIGWQMLCPYGFEATWNGGPEPTDIEIRWTDAAGVALPDRIDTIQHFVQSQAGNGVLTFHSGYQLKTASEYLLWVCGPASATKWGLSPLDTMVDTSAFPAVITMRWQFIRPHQTVHFAAGEPFARLLPYPKAYLAGCAAGAGKRNEVQIIDDADAIEQELTRLVDSTVVQKVFDRLSAGKFSQNGHAKHADARRDPSRWAQQLQDAPPVSCLCPTYGRVALLEEAIQSFLRQDYPGPKELIILNDYAAQTLQFDHPEVTVVNTQQRFGSIGEKYKAAVELAAHDLLVPWHDDDIYLPHRLSLSVALLQKQKRTFFKAEQAWFLNDGKFSGPDINVFHGGSCWTRALFEEAQGYPSKDLGYDIEFEERCRQFHADAVRPYSLRAEDVYYIYRWGGTGSYHASTFGQPDLLQQVADFVENRANWGLEPQGDIKLNPRWRQDYMALVQEFLQTGKAKLSEEEPEFPPPFFIIPSPEPLSAEAAAQLFRGDYPANLSVVLPAANESVLLQRTVEQFAKTLPPNSEIIVVDNGSTDGCANFLLAEPQANVTLIQTSEALGVAGARNRGLLQAQGEVVVFADSHIDVPENWWQPLVATLNRPHVGLVGPGIGIMGNPNTTFAYGQRIAEPNLRTEWLPKKEEEPYAVPALGGGFMAMRHDTLKAAGAFDDGMPKWGLEDTEICIRYWLLGYEVWTAPSVNIMHYFRKDRPYSGVQVKHVTHNVLRTALLHFGQSRIARVVKALQERPEFSDAMSLTVDTDVWCRRAELNARRMHDDDWFFAKFANCCNV